MTVEDVSIDERAFRVARRLLRIVGDSGGLDSVLAAVAKMIRSGGLHDIRANKRRFDGVVILAEAVLAGSDRIAVPSMFHAIDLFPGLLEGEARVLDLLHAIKDRSGVHLEEAPGLLCDEILTGVGGGASYACGDAPCKAAAAVLGHSGGACRLKPGGDPNAWAHPGCSCLFFKVLKRDVPWWLPWALLIALVLLIISGGTASVPTAKLAAAGLGLLFAIEWTPAEPSSGGAI